MINETTRLDVSDFKWDENKGKANLTNLDIEKPTHYLNVMSQYRGIRFKMCNIIRHNDRIIMWQYVSIENHYSLEIINDEN